MKNFLKKILMGSIMLIMCLSMSITVLADYDPDTDERDDTGTYIVDNYTQRDSNVTLFIYAQTSDVDTKLFEYAFSFGYFGPTSQDNPDVDANYDWNNYKSLDFYFRAANIDKYDELDGEEIWVDQFSIENGYYTFASALDVNTLDPTDFYSGTEHNYLYVSNENIRLYTMQGSDEWKNSHKDAFSEWAKKTDAALSQKSFAAEEETTIEETPETVTEETTIEPITEETSITETTITIPEVTEPTGKKANTLPTILIGILCFAILGFFGYIYTKRK